ncbi:MAG: hypothetical protein WCA97_08545 [Terriglobales bacterium]|jgi:sensor domain CHASE-containing protein
MVPDRKNNPIPASDRLDSWKEIACYLQRGVRTVHRWEREEGLPVHRHNHKKAASVHAFRSELDQWLERRTRAQQDWAASGAKVTVFPQSRAEFLPADVSPSEDSPGREWQVRSPIRVLGNPVLLWIAIAATLAMLAYIIAHGQFRLELRP